MLGAIWAARHNSGSQSRITRTKATFDMLMSKQWDRDYIEARQKFIAAFRENDTILNALKIELKSKGVSKGKRKKTEMQNSSLHYSVKQIINDYELMFIGINSNVLDEGIIKTFKRSMTIRDYEKSKTYIEKIQQDSNLKAYENFVDGAQRWQKERELEERDATIPWYRRF